MKRQLLILQVVVVTVLGIVATAQAALASYGFGLAGRASYVILIQSNSTCQIRQESTLPRAAMEAQLRMMDRYLQRAEAGEEEDERPVTKPAEKPKPMTDEELRKKVLEQYEKQKQHQAIRGGDAKMEITEISSNAVQTVETTTYGSLGEGLANGASALYSFGFRSLKMDMDDKGKLRLTLVSSPAEEGGSRNMIKYWKMSGATGELRFVLPGDVIASGLPNTKGNATWVSMDPKTPDSYTALAKLAEAAVVITAEPGGVTVKEPLDSQVLQRQIWSRRPGGEPELPVTEAGPGFKAEAKSVKVTTVHEFPGAKQYAKSTARWGHQKSGLEIQAVLFVPKGRNCQSLSDVRVISARDDQGRAVKPPRDSAEGGYSSYRPYFSGGGDEQEKSSSPFNVNLELPAPDAQALEEVQVELLVTTSGQWKELKVPEVKADPQAVTDLASVLSGATLKVTKVTKQKMERSVTVVVRGPKEIAQLDFQAKIPGVKQVSSNAMNDNTVTKEGHSERTVTLMINAFGEDGEQVGGEVSIVVRFPTEMRKERVKVTLKELDLL